VDFLLINQNILYGGGNVLLHDPNEHDMQIHKVFSLVLLGSQPKRNTQRETEG
jgi:hypothetical protein